MPAEPLIFCLGLLVVAALAWVFWRWIRAALKHQQSHSAPLQGRPEPQPAAELPPLPRPAPPSRVPREVELIYAKPGQPESQRRLRINRLVLKDGQPHTLQCREGADPRPKSFRVDRLRQLRPLDPDASEVLTDPAAIRDWLERHLPIRTDPPAGSPTDPRGTGVAPKPRASATRTPAAYPPTIATPAAVESRQSQSTASAEADQVDQDNGATTVAVPLPLQALLPAGAKGFAVVDVETTGVHSSARIVEIAVLCLDAEGRVTREWGTLLNPGEPMTPKAKETNRLEDAMLLAAPSFEQIAAALAAILDAHVLVAHNLSFDLRMLQAHFDTVPELEIDLGRGLCTFRGFPGNPANDNKKSLVDLLAYHAVDVDPRQLHQAMADVRSLSAALRQGLAHLQPAESAVAVRRPGEQDRAAPVYPRAMAPAVSPPAATAPPRGRWQPMALQLTAGMSFMATGPKTKKQDTPIHRARDHVIGLGLQYDQRQKMASRRVPDLLLSTSLNLESTKMRQAKELGVPVLLAKDARSTSTLEQPLPAWHWLETES